MDLINDILWTYILIAMLLGCAVWFTLKTRFVQFRMIGEMVRLLKDSGGKEENGEKHISSFQAFAISLASRVGTGNLAGVATAIAVGGPGAIFWMWIIALLGASSAFVESTLAQLYKEKGKESFIGGPAYYMKKGLKKPWMGILFAILITITFGFAFNSVQSNTICAAVEHAFGINHIPMGIILTGLTLLIIFGGIQRIAKVSSIIVPIMALGYVGLALAIVLLNITHLPGVIETIISHAFGWQQALGGGMGAALMQGIKRGLFSNEAGMGSTPHAHAIADVENPEDQGEVAMIGVFIDTFVVLTMTALVILSSGVLEEMMSTGVKGTPVAQAAFRTGLKGFGPAFVAICLLFFAFSTIVGWYFFARQNVQYLFGKKAVVPFSLIVVVFVFLGSLLKVDLVWNLSDLFNGLMVIPNLMALIVLAGTVAKAAKGEKVEF